MLLFCPECSHEVSANAVSCPNCGHPMSVVPPVSAPVLEPIAERKVVTATPLRRESGLPPWAIVPIGLGALLLVFFAYLMFRSSNDEANTNINVNMAGRRTTTIDPTARDTTTTTVPSTSTDVSSVPDTTVSMPPSGSSMPSTTTTVPGSTASAPVNVPPDTGTVKITAKVLTARSEPQAVRSTKFYLLDRDLETILAAANVEPIEGNSLAGSMGLAAVFPERYGDFQRAAMRAIAGHVKYTGTTDSGGNASLSNVDPKQYYLFGITRIGRGFAMWDAPVSITAGENILNLSPPRVTEIPGSPS